MTYVGETGEFAHATLGVVAVVVVLGVLLSPWLIPLFRSITKFLRQCRKEWPLGLLAMAAILYGSTKGPTPPQVEWDTDSFATYSAEWDTNTWKAVSFTWTKNPTVSASATVYIDYKPISGGEWTTDGTTVIANGNYTFTRSAVVTNYRYRVYSDWIPSTPVHTNGVWLGTVLEKPRGTVGVDKIIVIKGKIIENGKEIAP